MIGLGALIKKELQEQLKTYKLPIVAGVFTVLFGLGLPLMIHYLNIHIVVGDAELEMPVMTGVEVLGAYAGHLELWGVLTVILIGMGAIARERKSGTAAMTLCKPVGRGAFVIAKLVGLGVTFFISLGLAGLVCYNFTYILFEEVNGLPAFLYLNLLLGLFFLACLSMVLLCSSLFKHQLAAGGVGISSDNRAGHHVCDTSDWGLYPWQVSKLGHGYCSRKCPWCLVGSRGKPRHNSRLPLLVVAHPAAQGVIGIAKRRPYLICNYTGNEGETADAR